MRTTKKIDENRRDMVQAAAMKKKAAPVIKEPETEEAHFLKPIPRAASESPHTLPIRITAANEKPGDFLFMIPPKLT